MKKFMNEFKEFALRGNVIDLSIGVLIGGAFSTLVGAFTDDVITPILNIFGNPADGLGWVIPLPGGSAGILLGEFISAIVNFIIMAFVIFIIMKSINKLMSLGKKEEVQEEAAPAGPTSEELLAEIRDLLKENKNA
jgi:large conductance mechanosensitive channel